MIWRAGFGLQATHWRSLMYNVIVVSFILLSYITTVVVFLSLFDPDILSNIGPIPFLRINWSHLVFHHEHYTLKINPNIVPSVLRANQYSVVILQNWLSSVSPRLLDMKSYFWPRHSVRNGLVRCAAVVFCFSASHIVYVFVKIDLNKAAPQT